MVIFRKKRNNYGQFLSKQSIPVKVNITNFICQYGTLVCNPDPTPHP